MLTSGLSTDFATALPWQRQIIVMAWITYGAYYLGRVNISTAMPGMEISLGFTKSQVGLISTGFFWAYALGQLINGRLGDRLSPRWFVLIGVLASAGINLIFGLFSAWFVLIILWTLNGYFQATGWGPILRLLANWLTPSQRRKISGVFGSCFVAGNAITWLLTGWLVANFGWRVAFWFPAILLILIGLSWYIIIRDTPELTGQPAVNTPNDTEDTSQQTNTNLWAGLIASLRRFWSLSAAAAFVGFCLVSLILVGSDLLR